MKRILKLFSFWFFIINILIIILNLIGWDDMNILLIGLDPILNYLVYKQPFRRIIWNDGPTFYMYIAHVFTYTMYGGGIDIIIIGIKRLVHIIKSSIGNKLNK